MAMSQNISLIPKTFSSSPGLGVAAARAFMEMYKSRLFDYKRKDNISKQLGLVTFRITPLCNLRCVMCNQRGTTGVLKGKYANDESKKIVPIEVYKKFIDEISVKKPILYVWGGEPFLYPNFLDLAQYMAKKCPAFTVNTNGTFLAENAERIVRDKWFTTFVSLDGFEDVNDQIRGKGSYKRVIEGFEAINREKKRQKSKLPHLSVVTTVSNMNYKYLDRLVEELPKYGLSWHVINLGTYITEQRGEEHRKYMQDHLGIDPSCWRGFANGYNEGIDGKEFAEILARVHKIKTGYPVLTVPVINPDKIGDYHGKLDTLVRDHCFCPWFYSNIDYNGDVHFCADYPDYVIGNIKEQSFFDIYNGERAQKFRKELREAPNGVFPGCNRCYQLMLLGKRRKGY